MVQKIVAVTYDDIWYAKNMEVLSDRTVKLTFGEKVVELDLTNQTEKEALDMPLGDLLDMGRTITPPIPKPAKPKPPQKKQGRNNDYFAGMRDYAKNHGMTIPQDTHGNYLYHKVKGLRDGYETHLASQDP
jgi:hypothetical protein